MKLDKTRLLCPPKECMYIFSVALLRLKIVIFTSFLTQVNGILKDTMLLFTNS